MTTETTAPSTGTVEQAPASETTSQLDTTQEPLAEATQGLSEKTKSADKKADDLVQKYKLSVDGSELEVDLEELKKGYALNKSITQRAQEAAKIKKEAETERAQIQNLFQQLKSDPKAYLQLGQQLGLDVKKMAEELVWEQIQFEKLSPAEKKAIELQRINDEKEEKLAEYKRKEEQQQEAQLVKQFEAEIEDDVLSVAKMASFKQLTPRLVARIAEIYDNHIKAEGTKPTREFVAKKVRQWVDQDVDEVLSNEDIEVLAKRLPKEALSKLNQWHLDQARTKNLPNFGTSKGTNPNKQSKKEETKKMGIDDWLKSV